MLVAVTHLGPPSGGENWLDSCASLACATIPYHVLLLAPYHTTLADAVVSLVAFHLRNTNNVGQLLTHVSVVTAKGTNILGINLFMQSSRFCFTIGASLSKRWTY